MSVSVGQRVTGRGGARRPGRDRKTRSNASGTAGGRTRVTATGVPLGVRGRTGSRKLAQVFVQVVAVIEMHDMRIAGPPLGGDIEQHPVPLICRAYSVFKD